MAPSALRQRKVLIVDDHPDCARLLARVVDTLGHSPLIVDGYLGAVEAVREATFADFRALLDAAKGDDRAMILLMLNAALYLQEVVSLEWGDLNNGCLVTHRKKTGKCVGVAVLWPETLEALSAVKKQGDAIFFSEQGAPLNVSGAGKRFRKVRKAAKLTTKDGRAEDVTASQLRDGACTAAVQANVTGDLCKLLVGHRSGIADQYVKRLPSMVAPACEAIHRAYLP